LKGYAHALFGAGLSALLSPDPLWAALWGLVGSKVPDLDLKKMHRKLLHNVFAMLLLSLLVGSIDRRGGVYFMVGYASHIFLDSFTVRGVWALWPLYDRPLGIRAFRSDWRLANAAVAALGALLLIYSLYKAAAGQ